VSNDLVEITQDGKLRLHFHPGQYRAWCSEKRFIAILAGTQGGKTSFGPHWLHREMQLKGPGDYMAVTPTFPLLELKALPEFRKLFEDTLFLGRYVGSPSRQFRLSEFGQKKLFGDSGRDYQTNVFFGYAADPDTLESATAKAVWADEAGQKKFKLASWEALQRRLSIHLGRALFTTTIYNLGWLKTQFWDKWKAGNPDYEVIRFKSTENPNFPKAEYERAKESLPLWKFQMFYDALFTRPAGLIYDCIDEELHKVPRFTIPNNWQRYLGLDFGAVNTVGMFYAEDPRELVYPDGTKYHKLYAYREYKAGGRTAKEHTEKLTLNEPMIPICVGGSKSEGQWRDEFRAAGLPVQEPDVSEVEVGIDRVYGANKRNEIHYFNDLTGFWEQKLTYSRELDDNGEATEKIEDKETFHYMDAERYIIGWLKRHRSSGIHV
jgi:hypothetical protein